MNKTTIGCANCKYYYNGQCINADLCCMSSQSFSYTLKSPYKMPTEIVINGVTYIRKESDKK